MSDTKKYYYLKLKENFFDTDSMIILESMPDGFIYSNILLKMYLKSLKYDGMMLLNGTIPYNAQMISTVTRNTVGTVEKALKIFHNLGLIEVLDNGAIYMNDIQLFIGKSSTEGERKKAARLKLENQGLIQIGQKADICPPEIEIEKEIDTQMDKTASCESGDCTTGLKDTSIKQGFETAPTDQEKQIDQESKRLEDFEKIYEIYPRHQGRQDGYKRYKQWLVGRKTPTGKVKLTNRQMWLAVRKYADSVKGCDPQYIKMFSTFMGNSILDYVDKESDKDD